MPPYTDRDSFYSSRGAYPLLGNSASDLRLRLIRYAEQIAAMLLGSGLKLGCSPTVPPRYRFKISPNSYERCWGVLAVVLL